MSDTTTNQPTDETSRAGDGGEAKSLARPLLALALAAGAAAAAYLVVRLVLAREHPRDRAEHLITACESLLDQLQEGLARLHDGAASPSQE